MKSSRTAKTLQRFKIRKFGIIALFAFLMFSNLVALMQSFNGELFFMFNSILCIVRFILYGQLIAFRIKGKNTYINFLAILIIIEVISLVPQLLLDYEILELSSTLLYYILLDAYSQILVIFLLCDEFVYVRNLNDAISVYHKMLNKSEKR